VRSIIIPTTLSTAGRLTRCMSGRRRIISSSTRAIFGFACVVFLGRQCTENENAKKERKKKNEKDTDNHFELKH